MAIIKARAKSEEVRAHAGHSSNQWKQFMKFTRLEAESLLQRCVDASTWIDITDGDQNKVLEAVNLRLQNNDIPLVSLEILNWRMPKAMLEINRKFNDTSTRAETSGVKPPSDDLPARASYYDPARDGTD